MRLFTLYVRHLVSHAAKRYLRQGSGTAMVLAFVARWIFAGLLAATAFALGLLVEHIGAVRGRAITPADVSGLLSQHYLHALVALIAAMTLLPERNWLEVSAYRPLPVSPRGIALVDALLGLVRLPLLLFLAFAAGLYAGGIVPGAWFAATILLATASALTAIHLHQLLRAGNRRFYALTAGIALTVFADAFAGGAIAAAFSQIVDGRWGMPIGTVAVLGATLLTVSTRASHLEYDGGKDRLRSTPRGTASPVTRMERSIPRGTAGPVTRMAILEWKMLRRCSYPRYQARAIVLLLALLLILMVLTPDEAYGLITALFVVAGLAASYAQLAFAWNSDYFDGLMVLPVQLDTHVRARYLVGAVIATISAVVMLLVITVSGASSLLAVSACYTLTLGWLIAPLIRTSMAWSRPVSLDGSAIGNLKAYSWHLYPLAFALWIGTQLLISLTTIRTAALALFGLGAIGLLIQPAMLRRLALDLEANLPEMAERLRTPT